MNLITIILDNTQILRNITIENWSYTKNTVIHCISAVLLQFKDYS